MDPFWELVLLAIAFGIMCVVALTIILLARISHWCNRTYKETKLTNQYLKWLYDNEQAKRGPQ